MADAVVNRSEKKRRPRKKVRATEDASSSSSESGDELDFFVGGPMSAAAGRKARELAERASEASAAQRADSYMQKIIADPLSQIVNAVRDLEDFSEEVIRTSISRMFDDGLQYDDPSKVVEYIKHGPPAPTTPKEKPVTTKSSAKSEPAPVTASASQAAPGPSAPFHLSTVSRPGANDQTGVHSLPMASKLEIAASHPDLQTAVTALCSWASVVGAQKASKQFFQGKAPELLMLSILNTPAALFQSKAIQDSLSSLFKYIFFVAGDDDASTKASGVATTLLRSLASVSSSKEAARNAGLLVAGSSSALTRIADGLAAGVRALSQVLGEANESLALTDNDNSKTATSPRSYLNNIDDSINKLAKSAHKNVPVVGSDAASFKNLFAIRDARFEILDLQKQALNHIETAKNEPEPTVASNLVISDRLLSNASKAFQQVRAANKEAVDKLIIEAKLLPKAQNSAVMGSPISTAIANERTNLLKSRTSELNLCEENLTNMLRMKASMEAELDALVRDITSASSRRDSLRAEVSRLVASTSSGPSSASSPQSSLSAPEFDSRIISEKLNAFTENLSNIGSSVVTGLLSRGGKSDSFFSSTNVTVESSSSSEERKTQSFQAFESYAESEYLCLEALVNRIVLLRGRIQLKQRELAEYKKIGVSGILNNLSTELMQLERNLSEDIETVKALQSCLADNLQVLWNPTDATMAGKWSHTRAVADRARLLLVASGLPVHPLVSKFSSGGSSSATSAAAVAPRSVAAVSAAPKVAWKKVDPPATTEILKDVGSSETAAEGSSASVDSTVVSAEAAVAASPASTPAKGPTSFKQIAAASTPKEKSASKEQATPKKTPVKKEQPASTPASSAKGKSAAPKSAESAPATPSQSVAVVSTSPAPTSNATPGAKGDDSSSPLPKRAPRQAKKPATPATASS